MSWKTRMADRIVTCLEGGTVASYGGRVRTASPGPKTMREFEELTGYGSVSINAGLAEARDRGDLVTCRNGIYYLATTAAEIHGYRRTRLKPIIKGVRRLRNIVASAAIKLGSGGVPDVTLDDIAYDLGQMADRLDRIANRP
jgi:hypothetical protein